MTQDDVKLFDLMANDAEYRTETLRRYKDKMPDHPAIKEQKILDGATAPLQERISKLEQQLAERSSADRYEQERATMRARGFSDKRIKELEDRMEKAAKEEGMLFSSYVAAADTLRRLDMPIGPSTVGVGNPFGMPSDGGREQWREDLASRDPKVNPALMPRRERKVYIRKLATQASNDFKESLGV